MFDYELAEADKLTETFDSLIGRIQDQAVAAGLSEAFYNHVQDLRDLADEGDEIGVDICLDMIAEIMDDVRELT